MDRKTYCEYYVGPQAPPPRVRRSIKISMVAIPICLLFLRLLPIGLNALPGEVGMKLRLVLTMVSRSPFGWIYA
ncbi:MAG: hypothetical protein DCC49_10510 [Acidobacteria bacterium]|nr:MAG: hypothetical protein DCC49_10510 [Acidobacteriota bacterium]